MTQNLEEEGLKEARNSGWQCTVLLYHAPEECTSPDAYRHNASDSESTIIPCGRAACGSRIAAARTHWMLTPDLALCSELAGPTFDFGRISVTPLRRGPPETAPS